MSQRLLQLDDVRNTDSPDKVANLFQKLGYNASSFCPASWLSKTWSFQTAAQT